MTKGQMNKIDNESLLTAIQVDINIQIDIENFMIEKLNT